MVVKGLVLSPLPDLSLGKSGSLLYEAIQFQKKSLTGEEKDTIVDLTKAKKNRPKLTRRRGGSRESPFFYSLHSPF